MKFLSPSRDALVTTLQTMISGWCYERRKLQPLLSPDPGKADLTHRDEELRVLIEKTSRFLREEFGEVA